MNLHTGPSIDWFRQHGPGLTQTLAALAVAAGLGLWGALLLAPRPAPPPPALSPTPAPGADAGPVADWFGGGSARLRLTVIGLISSGENGAALLSIDGGPVRAYRVGQSLAPGIVLSAVRPDAVALDQAGAIEEVAMPASRPPIQGFLPAPANAPAK
ncbi:type II secretion system protein N [Castellaniella sp. GW247-6E4]|uniref:type II secretion system protein N n=1 Tax=Castellaniella sp. GW247-6E4 TaxID=3140380 RepID=UPI0033160190